MNNTTFVEKYFFLGLLFLSTLFVSVIFFPYISVIIVGMALSILLYPLYQKIHTYLPKNAHWLASLITIVICIISIGIPLLFLGSIVFDQLQNVYNSLSVVDSKPIMSKLTQTIETFLPTGFTFDMQTEITHFITSLTGNLRGFFTATLQTLFMLLLAILTLFYFLKDGLIIRKQIIETSPLGIPATEQLLATISKTINGILKGYIVIAVAQGLLMGIGLALFGVPNPVLWGLVAGIASLIPMVGTAFVSVPAILYLLITSSNPQALGLTVWAITLVGTIDNFLNPLIIGKQTDLPPLVILFSILGGIVLLGPIGILVGPLAVSIFRALLHIYQIDIQKK